MNGRLSGRQLFVLPLLLSLPMFSPICATAKRTTITYYHPWGNGDVLGKGFVAAGKEFERLHPDISVKILGGGDITKLLALMAAGLSPDVALVDERIASYSLMKLMGPIDDLVKLSRISKDDFYTPSWRECFYDSKMWAMPWGADANFGFLWNKDVFRQVGLDPERPPATLDELMIISPKLALQDDSGKLKRMAIAPWTTGYGNPNAIYTWGWSFGGEFFSDATGKITANDPKVLKALEWMQSIVAKAGGLAKVTSGNFALADVAMAGYTTLQVKETRKAKPKLDFGITQMPTVSADVKPGWIGGHKIIIPLGAKNRAAGWEWMKFITADPVGTAIPQTFIGSTPAYKHSKIYDTYEKDPNYAPFLKILKVAGHNRPITPAAERYGLELANAVARVFAGKKEPVVALDECTATVQKELNRIMERYKGRQKK